MESQFENLLDWFKNCLVIRQNGSVSIQALVISYSQNYDLKNIDKSSFHQALKNVSESSGIHLTFAKKKLKGKRHIILLGYDLKKKNENSSNLVDELPNSEQDSYSVKAQPRHVSVIVHSKSCESFSTPDGDLQASIFQELFDIF
eukprot:TCONS_00029624-protein